MAIEWGVLKGYILQNILKDVPVVDESGEVSGTRRFTDEQLLTWARWGLNELSFTHAEAATTRCLCDGASWVFDLPEDIVDSIEHTGLVVCPDLQSGEDRYLAPIRLSPGVWWPSGSPVPMKEASGWGFWEWPSGKLCLSFIPEPNTELVLRYFKVWDTPIDDSDILKIPRWLEQPLAYLIGAYACDPAGMQFSSINQWKRKQDSGTPETNPMHPQARYFLEMATRLLVKGGTQNRDNYYRMSQIDGYTYNGVYR